MADPGAALERARRLAPAVVVFDHGPGSLWSYIAAEDDKVVAAWAAVCRFPVKKTGMYEGVQAFPGYEELFQKVKGQGETSLARIESYRGQTGIHIPFTYGLALVEGRSSRAGRPGQGAGRLLGGMKRRSNGIGLLHKPTCCSSTSTVGIESKPRSASSTSSAASARRKRHLHDHQLAEVEGTCSRIAIMDRGRILARNARALIRIVGERDIVEITGEFAAAAFSEALGDIAGDAVELLSVADNLASLAVADTEQIPRVMDRLFRRKLAVTDLKIKSPGLETVFLKLTGRSLRD